MNTPYEAMGRLLIGDAPSRVGLREVNIWPETVRLWIEQGYPTEEVIDLDGQVRRKAVDWRDHFAFDMVQVGGWFDLLPMPGHKEVIEETESWIIIRDGAGAAFKRWKHISGTPEHIDFLMNSRVVWERDYRDHLLTVDRTRIDVAGAKQELQKRRTQGLWTFYGHQLIWETMRQTMGDLCMYTSLATDPGWIHDFNRVYTDFFKAHFKILLEEAGIPDSIRLCEDLAYNNGLFCSPQMLEELVFPYYREIVDFFHGYGLLVEFHTDGDIWRALPLIVDAGFDILNPLERKAGCDPLAMAETHGDRLAFIGGMDVRVLESGDRDLIRREVAALIEGMKARGARYVFGSDHSITPLVDYHDYQFTLEIYREHMNYL